MAINVLKYGFISNGTDCGTKITTSPKPPAPIALLDFRKFLLDFKHRIIKHKVGLLNLAEELGNVSKACKVMGLSRDTFYRYKSAVDEGGVEALLETTRRKPNLANRVDEATEQAVSLGD